MKRVRDWLEKNEFEYKFHDFIIDGLDNDQLIHWSMRIGWEILLNKRSTSFRTRSQLERQSIDEISALKLMQNQPTLIKRPVLVCNREILVGFDADRYKEVMSIS